MIESQAFYVGAIILLSTLFASTFGFGLGLVAMPFMVLILDIKTATPLIALVILTMAIFIFVKNWREVNFKSAWKIILGCIAGVPIGIYILKGTGDSIMKITLAVMIILYSIYSLFIRIKPTLKAEWPAFIVGLLSGGIGSAYNMGGPPVIIYGSLKKWPSSTFRSTLSSFVLPIGVMTVLSHFLGGLLTDKVLSYYFWSLPVIIIATFAGGILNRRIPTERFHKLIHICLILIGSFLLIRETLN